MMALADDARQMSTKNQRFQIRIRQYPTLVCYAASGKCLAPRVHPRRGHVSSSSHDGHNAHPRHGHVSSSSHDGHNAFFKSRRKGLSDHEPRVTRTYPTIVEHVLRARTQCMVKCACASIMIKPSPCYEQKRRPTMGTTPSKSCNTDTGGTETCNRKGCPRIANDNIAWRVRVSLCDACCTRHDIDTSTTPCAAGSIVCMACRGESSAQNLRLCTDCRTQTLGFMARTFSS